MLAGNPAHASTFELETADFGLIRIPPLTPTTKKLHHFLPLSNLQSNSQFSNFLCVSATLRLRVLPVDNLFQRERAKTRPSPNYHPIFIGSSGGRMLTMGDEKPRKKSLQTGRCHGKSREMSPLILAKKPDGRFRFNHERKMKHNLLRQRLLGIFVLFFLINGNAQSIIQIASSDTVSFFVRTDGSLWVGDYAHKLARWREQMGHASLEFNQHPQTSQAVAKMIELQSELTDHNFRRVF
jgi:hypothetical protein